MHARNMGEALELIMAERGWSQTRLGRELGQSQDWVSDIVRGRRDTFVKKAARLLNKVGWELHITPKSDIGGMEDGPVKRREFVAGAASALLVTSPKTTPFHDPSFVEELTRRSVRALYWVGGNSITTPIIRQARNIRLASTNGGRALQSAASDFMRQGAWILWQAGRPDLAIRFADNSFHLAAQAGDPDKQALACSALGYASIEPHRGGARASGNPASLGQSTLHISSKSAARAVEYARRGLAVPGIGDEPRAFLTGLLACGLANVPGQERQARIEVDHALHNDRLSAIDQADIAGIAGNALHDTGDRREALKMLEAATDLSVSHSPYLSARYLSDQIMIILDMRDPAHAASLMNALSHIVPLVDSTVLDRQVEQILQASKPWSAVREIREACARLRSVRMTVDPQ